MGPSAPLENFVPLVVDPWEDDLGVGWVSDFDFYGDGRAYVDLAQAAAVGAIIGVRSDLDVGAAFLLCMGMSPPAAQSAPGEHDKRHGHLMPNASRFSIHHSTFAIPYRDSLRDRALKKALRPAT